MAGKKKPQHTQAGSGSRDNAPAPLKASGSPAKQQRAGGGFELPFSLPDKDDLPVINMERLKKKLPWLVPTIYALAILSFFPLTNIYYNRTATHSLPRWSIIPDMDNQPRWKYQQANMLFADGRSSRPWPEGTVARGMLRDDTHYYYGIVNGQWATGLPPQIEINQALLERGRERYTIYCAQCHGDAGYGDGPVSRRAELLKEGTWTVPLTYHGDQVRDRPAGHIFNTITNGIRTMPAHGSQVSVEDRWAIIAWIRVLQESQHTTIDSLPSGKRAEMEARRPAAEEAPVAAEAAPTDEAAQADEAEAGTEQDAAAVDGAEAAADDATDTTDTDESDTAPQESGS